MGIRGKKTKKRAEIVQVQAGQTRMTPDEIARTLNRIYLALKSLKAKEGGLPEESAVGRKAVQGKASIINAIDGCPGEQIHLQIKGYDDSRAKDIVYG